MKKIFISHSSKDKEMVLDFVDFLQTGMGIYRKQIFCTSLKGTPAAGSEFFQEIKKEMADDVVVIPIMTENYLASKICLMELGAAWVLCGAEEKLLYPLLAGQLNYEGLKDTPLREIQMYRLEDEDNMASLYDQLCIRKVIDDMNTAVFAKKLPNFVNKIKNGTSKVKNVQSLETDKKYIEKDAGGNYIAKITQVRNVPSDYRCYRINGLVEEFLDESRSEKETHWLFYYAGVYPDLHVGDTVSFKIHRTELRDLPDLKHARNIYPNALEIVNSNVRR